MNVALGKFHDGNFMDGIVLKTVSKSILPVREVAVRGYALCRVRVFDGAHTFVENFPHNPTFSPGRRN